MLTHCCCYVVRENRSETSETLQKILLKWVWLRCRSSSPGWCNKADMIIPGSENQVNYVLTKEDTGI
jgi:hypothetical protein